MAKTAPTTPITIDWSVLAASPKRSGSLSASLLELR